MNGFSMDRSNAIRQQLVAEVQGYPSRRFATRWAAVLVVAGVLTGAGVSAGAYAAVGFLLPGPTHPSGQPVPETAAAIDAPESVIPGAPVVILLGDSVTQHVDSYTTVSLSDRPEGATHVRVTVVGLSAGSLSFGTSDGDGNPSTTWTKGDVAAGDAFTEFDFPLNDSVNALYLNPDGFAGTATVQYLAHIPTKLGTNESGQTFGVSGSDQGEPDLVAVEATNGVQGFVLRSDLDAGAGMFPVFESDGATVVGEFRVE